MGSLQQWFVCVPASEKVVTNALIGGYVVFCWQQSREILDSWNESQVPREDSWLLKWAVVLAGNEYRIKSTVPLGFKSAVIWVTYCCFPPCTASASLVTLMSCCFPPSSSSLLAHFCFPLALTNLLSILRQLLWSLNGDVKRSAERGSFILLNIHFNTQLRSSSQRRKCVDPSSLRTASREGT